MTSIVDECLKSISQINQDDLDGEMAVCESMLESYEKIFSLMEHYSDDNSSSLTFLESVVPTITIQEADAGTNPAPANPQPADQNTDQNVDSDDKKEKLWEFNPRGKNEKTGRKEHILKSIFLFIPRLILAVGRFIYRWIKSLFSGKQEAQAATKAAEQNMQQIEQEHPQIWDNQEFVDKLMVELTEQGGHYPSFTYSATSSYTNAQQVDTAEGKRILIYLPLNIDSMVNNLKDYDTSILKYFINILTQLTQISMTDENAAVAATAKLTNELVEKMSDVINHFSEEIKKENDIASQIRQTQDTRHTLIVDLPSGESNRNFTIFAEDLWQKFDEIGKLVKIINDDDTKITKLVNIIEDPNFNIELPEEGAVAGLKDMLNQLKGSTQLLLKQVQIIADLTDGFMKGMNKLKNHEYLSQLVAKLLGEAPTGGGSKDAADASDTDTNEVNAKGTKKPGIFNKQGPFDWVDLNYTVTDSTGKPIKENKHFAGFVVDWQKYKDKETRKKNVVNINSIAAKSAVVIDKDTKALTDTKTGQIVKQITESYVFDQFDQNDNIEPLEY